MKEFLYASMINKFQNLSGKTWSYSGHNDISSLRKKYPMVTLENSSDFKANYIIVLNWCEQHFGDNWIYEWNDFYFKHKEDAVFFSLRWS